jgi:hypothetical protein
LNRCGSEIQAKAAVVSVPPARDRQVGIHANRRSEIPLCFQRAVLLSPVIFTPGAGASELCIWQDWAIWIREDACPVFFLLLTGAPFLQDFARLQ